MIGKQIHAKGCSDAFKEGARNWGWLRKEWGEEEHDEDERVTETWGMRSHARCRHGNASLLLLHPGKELSLLVLVLEDGRRNELFQIKPLLCWRTLINLTTLPTIPVALVIMLATNPLKRMIWNFTGGPDIICGASCCMSASVGLTECVNIYEIISHTPGPEV